jgi:hypothetical protein
MSYSVDSDDMFVVPVHLYFRFKSSSMFDIKDNLFKCRNKYNIANIHKVKLKTLNSGWLPNQTLPKSLLVN